MKKKVYAYLHTHWDREWYRNKEDFNLRLLKVFDDVLYELKNNNAPYFYFDGQVVALLDYLKYRSENKNLIKKFIKEKKLSIGPYFASIDSFYAGYPILLKNLDLGLKISSEFHQDDFIGYMCDIFGISKSAFCALKDKKINKAIIWRGVNPEFINNNCNFKYGNIKTHWLVQGYFNDFLHAKNSLSQKANNIKNTLDKISKYAKSPLLLPIGGDHLGILKNANSLICEINKYLDDYEIILSSPFEYFEKSEFKNTPLTEEFLDNSHTYILQGCASSRIYQKVKNNYLENKISRIIEPLNYYLKLNYQKNIDFAYTTLLKCHAHDGIYGCSLDSVHRAIDARFEKVENILNSLEDNITSDFKNKYNIKGKTKDKIGLFNLGNIGNYNIVKIKTPYKIKNAQIIKKEKNFPKELLNDIYTIPVTEQITTIYTSLVEIDNSKNFSFSTKTVNKAKIKTKITDKSIENDYIALFIKNNKIQILNKKTNEKIHFKLTDIKDKGDSYNFAPFGEYKTLELKKTKIIEKGPLRFCLRLYFKDIYIDIYLDSYSKFLKFNSTINNKTKNHKLQAVFELGENIDKTISQDAFGIIKRNIDYNYKMQDFMPAIKPVEIKTNSYPMKNFVNFKNNSILTNGLCEYEIYKNELRICLLRAFGTISNPKNKARFVPAGPNLETIESQCLKKTTKEFAFLFGDYKEAFNNLDIFFENYIAIDGDFSENFEIQFDKIKKNSYFYCINDNKKVIFDYSDDIN